MRFAFIAKHRHIWPITWLCEVLNVSRSGYHAWLTRPISTRESHDAKLVAAIETSFKASDRTYGARRVWRDVLEDGLACGLHRIERLMRINALRARPRRRGKPKDDGERSVIADNLLDRDFETDRPNHKWLADFTYIWTAEGWLYVAVVLDLFSRRAVGWSMKADRDASLVMDALMMAVWRRGKIDALLHHSDQGSQYTSEQFQRLLADNGITCSMSRAGNVWDNSAMESFFSTLKTERTANKVYRTRNGSCRECGGNCRAAGSGHVTMAPVRPRGQGTLAREAGTEFPSHRPFASGSDRKPAAPRAASARFRRRAARSGS